MAIPDVKEPMSRQIVTPLLSKHRHLINDKAVGNDVRIASTSSIVKSVREFSGSFFSRRKNHFHMLQKLRFESSDILFTAGEMLLYGPMRRSSIK